MDVSLPQQRAAFVYSVSGDTDQGYSRAIIQRLRPTSRKPRFTPRSRMNWKLKAHIQKAVSLLPSPLSYESYYWIQRHFGSLRRPDPLEKLSAGIETWKRIERHRNPEGGTFFEVGTGRVPIAPISFWLMGADGTVTMDANPYLREELLRESLACISRSATEVRSMFGPRLHPERFDLLLDLAGRESASVSEILETCGIDYRAPADAQDTSLESGLIDFHTSYNVLEHIPPEIIHGIFLEGDRILSSEGMFVHRIDYSDHFSHSDRSISAINFLQYSDGAWERYAGNRYMYMNRLRHDDFLDLIDTIGHQVVESEPSQDQWCLELLESGHFRVDPRFNDKTDHILSIVSSWIVSRRIDPEDESHS